MKKLFALTSVTALGGLVVPAVFGGCSSTEILARPDAAATAPVDPNVAIDTPTGDGGTSVPKDASGDARTDAAFDPFREEQTVGNECQVDRDCEVPGTVNDNICTRGAAKDGDIYGSPVCISACIANPFASTVADLLCDGNRDQAGNYNAPGLCVADPGSPFGVCFPACRFDSTTIIQGCRGGNKCEGNDYSYLDGAKKVVALGHCNAACTKDEECLGTPGQKCRKETGECLTAPTPFTKQVGEGCNGAAETRECACISLRGGVNADKGFCTSVCVTGAAGNAACDGAKAGWKCIAPIEAKTLSGQVLFTGQPDGILGECLLPCTDDPSCAAVETASGAKGKCVEYAGGKACTITNP